MNERLRKVSPQLSLTHIELLGHEPRRSTSTSIPLIEPSRCEKIALLVLGEREEKSAQQKSALGLAKRPSIGAKAIDVLLFEEFGFNGGNGRDAPGIGNRQRPTDSGEQQGRIDPRIARGPLPATSGWRQSEETSARIPSASALQCPDCGFGATAAIARNPETHVRRECAQCSGRSPRYPRRVLASAIR